MEVFDEISQAEYCSNTKQVLSSKRVFQKTKNTSASKTQRQTTKSFTNKKNYSLIPFKLLVCRYKNGYLSKNCFTTLCARCRHCRALYSVTCRG